MEEFYNLLNYPFFIRSLIVAGLTGIICSVMGVFVVLRKIVYIGDGISHASFTGIAIGLILGINPTLTAFIFCSCIGCLIPYLSKKGKFREDLGTGILFPASISMGLILMSKAKISGNQISSYLFGSVLTSTELDVKIILCVTFLTLLLVYTFRKELLCLTFDPGSARLMGIPVLKLTYLLFFLISTVIVVSTKVVGVILVSTLLITPPVIMLKFSNDFYKFLIYSGLIGFLLSESGLILSFVLNTPPGATITLLSTFVFLLSLNIKK